MSVNKNGTAVMILKGIALYFICVVVGILLLALIVKLTGISADVIKAVNQFIKVFAVFIACAYSVNGNRVIVKGLLIGLFGSIVTHLVFLLFNGGSSFLSIVLDCVFLAIAGAICSLVALIKSR